MSITTFFSDIAEMDYVIPISVKIYFVIILIILITIFAFILRNSNSDNAGILKKNYIWFYVIILFNLINILAILYYYKTKKGSFKGVAGPKGAVGSKGGRGDFITCSFCKNNIYSQKTKRYGLVVSLYDGELVYNEEAQQRISNIKAELSKINISIDDVSSSSLTNMIDNRLNYANKLNLLIKIVYSLAINEFNRLITNGITNKPGSFYRPSGKTGFFSIGDTAFSKSEATDLNAFLINGDVRNPVLFNNIIKTGIVKSGLNGKKRNEYYTIWEPKPPKGFVSLGDVIEFGNKLPKTNIVACVNKKCVKQISPDDLELVFVFSGVRGGINDFNDNTINDIFEITFNLENQKESENELILFSIWRTPLNTFLVNTTDDSKFYNNTLLYNITGGRTDIFDNRGNINKSFKNKVIRKLKNIKLSKLIRSALLNAYFSQIYAEELKQIKNENKEMPEAYINKNYVKTVIDNISSSISIDIDKSKNAFDIMKIMFPDGLNTNVIFNDDESKNLNGTYLSNAQKMFIKLLKIMFPPSRPAYIIKNRCLSYNRIDEKRRKLVSNLISTLEKYNTLFNKYSKNPTLCNDGGSNWETIIKNINTSDDLLHRNFRHINKYMDKILNMDFDYFSNSRLELILNEFTKRVNMLENICGSLVKED